jgi:hypothetical protein
VALTAEDDLSSLGTLAEGVDRRADLLTWREPEEHSGVEAVKIGDDRGDGQEEKQHCRNHQKQLGCGEAVRTVARDKVRRVETHLDSLDDELSCRLAESVRAETAIEPYTSPPGSVRLVVLEFSGQENGDENLEDAPLHADDRDDA